jgi:hypothetical protein
MTVKSHDAGFLGGAALGLFGGMILGALVAVMAQSATVR